MGAMNAWDECMGWIHEMGACMHVMDVQDGLCDEYMGWMHAMDVLIEKLVPINFVLFEF